MMITMITVEVVKVTVNQVIDMIAVWHGFVTTVRTMLMIVFMALAVMVGSARIWIGDAHFQNVFIAMAFMKGMQMAIVKKVGMITVPKGVMATAGAVDMGMVSVGLMGRLSSIHRKYLLKNSEASIAPRVGMRQKVNAGDSHFKKTEPNQSTSLGMGPGRLRWNSEASLHVPLKLRIL